MILQANDFKIENDGIWVSKKAIEECKKHYKQVAEYCYDGKEWVEMAMY